MGHQKVCHQEDINIKGGECGVCLPPLLYHTYFACICLVCHAYIFIHYDCFILVYSITKSYKHHLFPVQIKIVITNFVVSCKVVNYVTLQHKW